MSEPFVGEIRMFAGNLAPRNWALCDGQLLAISQNDALFSLLGTVYGGDGRTTFGLPDLRGRIPLHAGSGPGLSPRSLGSKAGSENVTLTSTHLPNHRHPWKATGNGAIAPSPAEALLAQTQPDIYIDNIDDPAGLAPQAVSSVGGSGAHTNTMPFLCVNFIIALFGIFPSRN